MSYFASAAEAATRLDLPLLLESEADPRFLERHLRLSRFAVPTPQAARLFHRLSGALADQGIAFSAVTGGALWVAGPSGSLEHLPWAVGLADHLARSGGLVGIADRSGSGPLAQLAAEGQRRRVASTAAEGVYGGPVMSVATDLAGVRILDRAQAAEAAANPTAVISWLVLSDPLPESLEGPYPSPTGLLGTLFAASYRDHSSRELQAIVVGLRAAGHRLLGFVALNPAAAADPRVQEKESRRTWVSMSGLPIPGPKSRTEVPAEAMSEPKPEAKPRPEPVATPPPKPIPVASSTPPEPTSITPPEPTSIGPPEPRPAEPREVAFDRAPAGPPPGWGPEPLVAPSVEPIRVPLLSTWDQQVRRDVRRRRGGGALLAVVVSIGVLAVVYQFFLRPSGVGLSRRAIPVAVESDSGTTPATRLESPAPTGFGLVAPADSSAVAVIRDSVPSDTLRTRIASVLIPGPTAEDSSGAPVVPPAADSARVGTNPRPEPPPGRSPSAVERASRQSAPALPGSTLRAPLPSPRPADEGAAAVPAGTGFVIHLSSYKLALEAEQQVAELARQGVDARTLRVDVPDRGTWYRIVTGNFASFAQAESAALALQARGVIPYAHIAGNGGQGTPIPVGTLDRIRP